MHLLSSHDIEFDIVSRADMVVRPVGDGTPIPQAIYWEPSAVSSCINSLMNIFLSKSKLMLSCLKQTTETSWSDVGDRMSDKMLGESEQKLGKETQSLKRQVNFL
jgi:hypothetical protein